MKTTIQFGMWALVLVLLGGMAAAQVCEGTLSAPTREVYVGDNFDLTFFNAEVNSTGGSITLNLPPELSLTAGTNPELAISPFSSYDWTVQASVAGTYVVNVTLESAGVNCTRSFNPVIVDPVDAPIIVPVLTDLTTLTLNQPVSVDLDLTNVGGEARDVSGNLVVNSASSMVPLTFAHALIANSTTESSTHTLTPEHCGVDSVTAYVTDIHDANDLDVAPVQVTDLFTVVGSDVAFTTISAESPVAQGDTATMSFTVENIGSMDTTGVEVDISVDGSNVGTVTIGSLLVGASDSGSFDYPVGLLPAGDHTVAFTIRSDLECSSVNNQVSRTFNVTGAVGPFCGDGSCNGGESCSSCASDCGTCSTPASGGGGGGGGGSGGGSSRTFILYLTPESPTQSLDLRTGDTVKYTWKNEEYSFVFRYVYSDRAKMGVSKSTSYKEYSLDENKKYKLNLDSSVEADLGVIGTQMHLGSGNFTFELLNIPDRKPIITLPFFGKKKTVTPAPEQTESSAELEAEPEAEPVEQDNYSEGVLEFIENLTVRSSAPLWAGIGLALLIILLGLGLYFFVARKDDE